MQKSTKTIMLSISEQEERKTGKELYSYQKGAIQKIFQCFETAAEDYHLLYQLPTGGGKTVIFSEIVSQYLKTHKKKVLVMTHRIELCKQTSSVLTEFGVQNKVIDSKANLEDQSNFQCFVAMVETLNNRLKDDKLDISDIGLIIIDEDVPGGGSSFILQELLNNQDVYEHLDSKPCLVTAKEHRPAYGSDGDYISKPSFEDIFEEIYTVMNEANPSKYKNIL